MEIFQSHNDEGILGKLTPKQSFIAGLVSGVLSLCTVGFIILLGIFFFRPDIISGKSLALGGLGNTVKNNPTT